MGRILLVVDPQIDFISGSLPVPGAAKAMDALGEYIGSNNGKYDIKIVTLDFHPWNHCSFAPNGGQWPRHCVAHAKGAAIWPGLVEPLFSTAGQTYVEMKGQDAAREEYSIFRNEDAARRIARLAQDAEKIDICGIAGDICVLNTLKEGVNLLGKDKFNVLQRFAPSLDGGAALESFIRELN